MGAFSGSLELPPHTLLLRPVSRSSSVRTRLPPCSGCPHVPPGAATKGSWGTIVTSVQGSVYRVLSKPRLPRAWQNQDHRCSSGALLATVAARVGSTGPLSHGAGRSLRGTHGDQRTLSYLCFRRTLCGAGMVASVGRAAGSPLRGLSVDGQERVADFFSSLLRVKVDRCRLCAPR